MGLGLNSEGGGAVPRHALPNIVGRADKVARPEKNVVILQKKNGVALIILNRPEVRNAINDQVVQELALAIADVANDEEIKVAVITGAGSAFCAGADFRFSKVRTGEISEEKAEDLSSVFKEVRQGHLLHKMQLGVCLALQRLGKVTIAMVNGDAVGGGFDLSLACDLRVGSRNARFMAYTRMAVIPELGGSWFLPRVVGLGKALELILTGDFCDAEEAYRIGILNKLVPPDKLEEVTLDLATKLAKGPSIAHRLSKTMVYKGLEVDLETALQFMSACIDITTSSQDYKSAIRAFAQKTAPVFEGK